MIRKSIAVMMTILFLVGIFSLNISVGAATHEDWPMFHHDLALSGYTDSTAPNTNETLWIYHTNSSVSSSPAIVDGRLYIGVLDGSLIALEANTGAALWSYTTRGPIYSSPAVAYDKVYFLSMDGNVYALDAVTGAVVWTTVVGPGSYDWSSPAVHNNRVFIGASNGRVHCLDAATGAFIWSTPTGGSPNGPITVFNGKVYSGTHNFDDAAPTLVALDELTGATIWTYSYTATHPGLAGMINSNGAAVVDGDGDGDLEVYFGLYVWGDGGIGQAVALDEATGTEVWLYTFRAITAPGGYGPGMSTSTPAVHAGKIYIGSDDGYVYALNAGTGAKVWDLQTSGAVWSAPAVADGKVFAASLDHTVYAMDEGTGNLLWRYNTSLSRMEGSPAVACGKVFVGNENGKVYCFGTSVISVSVDIKPGSWPNPINVGSKGVFAVAICGSKDFDVMTIDPATVKIYIEGVAQGVSPIRWSYEDVATPFIGPPGGGHALGGDGCLDIVFHFDTQTVVTKLGLAGHVGETIPLIIRGNLKEAAGGTPIQGQDYVWILKPKAK